MDDIRFLAGPIVARYQDKFEADRQAVQKAVEEKAAKKREELEAKKRAEEEAKKAAEPIKKDGDAAVNGDAEMKDADVIQLDGVDESVDEKKK